MSDDEIVEDNPLAIQLGLILGIYALSLAISIFFINKATLRGTSKIILTLSMIYLSFFYFFKYYGNI